MLVAGALVCLRWSFFALRCRLGRPPCRPCDGEEDEKEEEAAAAAALVVFDAAGGKLEPLKDGALTMTGLEEAEFTAVSRADRRILHKKKKQSELETDESLGNFSGY